MTELARLVVKQGVVTSTDADVTQSRTHMGGPEEIWQDELALEVLAQFLFAVICRPLLNSSLIVVA